MRTKPWDILKAMRRALVLLDETVYSVVSYPF